MEDYKKKYEEAMLRMKKWVECSEITDPEEVAEFVFPELKESEDERIKKSLIDFLDDVWHLGKNANFDKYDKADCSEWISWLEKQGEQKSAWSEEDEKMWSTISDLLFEGYKLSDKKVSWDKIRCWLLPKIVYLKDKVRPQPKQEWSEEDEKLYTWCASAIQTRYSDGLFTMDEYRETSLWLKSIKERYTWKPSDEQMDALDYYANSLCTYCDRQDDLRSLFNDLKNL